MMGDRLLATRGRKGDTAAQGRMRTALYEAALLLPGSAIILPLLWWLDGDASARLRTALRHGRDWCGRRLSRGRDA